MPVFYNGDQLISRLHKGSLQLRVLGFKRFCAHIFFPPVIETKKRERERSVSVRKFFSYYFVEQRGKETCTLVSPRKTTKQQHPIWKMVYPLRFFFFSISKANSEYFIFFFFFKIFELERIIFMRSGISIQ